MVASSQARHDAFLSYGHADREISAVVERELERLGRRWYKRRALRVFRDETSMAASPALWRSIESALDCSKWLVLLASPAAATSDWVERELAHWLETDERAERVIIIAVAGDAPWPTLNGEQSSLPPSLRTALGGEPRWIDLRWTQAVDSVDVEDPRFRSLVADAAAAIHGVPKDDLVGEDLRQHRQAVRVRRLVAVVLALLTVVAGVVAVDRSNALSDLEKANGTLDELNVQIGEANAELDAARAELDAARAEARALNLSVQANRASDAYTAIGLALQAEAATPEPTLEAFQARVTATHRLGRMAFELARPTPPIPGLDEATDPSISPTGDLIAAVVENELVVYETATGEVTPIHAFEGRPRRLIAWSRDGRQLVVAETTSTDVGNSYRLVGVRFGGTAGLPATIQLTAWSSGETPNPAWSPDGSMAIVSSRQGLEIWGFDWNGDPVIVEPQFIPGGVESTDHAGDIAWISENVVGVRWLLSLFVVDLDQRAVVSRIDRLSSSGVSSELAADGSFFAAQPVMGIPRIVVYDVARDLPAGFVNLASRYVDMAWNPDATFLAVASEEQVRVVAVTPEDALVEVTEEALELPDVEPRAVRWVGRDVLAVLATDGTLYRWQLRRVSTEFEGGQSIEWVHGTSGRGAIWSYDERKLRIFDMKGDEGPDFRQTWTYNSGSLHEIGAATSDGLYVFNYPSSDRMSPSHTFLYFLPFYDSDLEAELIAEFTSSVDALDPLGRFAIVDADEAAHLVRLPDLQPVEQFEPFDLVVWSDDGRLLAVVGKGMVSVHRLDDDGLGPTLGAATKLGSGRVHSMAFSPDTDQLAVLSSTEDRAGLLSIVVVDGTRETSEISHPLGATDGAVSWISDDALLVSSSTASVVIDLEAGSSEPFEIVDDYTVSRVSEIVSYPISLEEAVVDVSFLGDENAYQMVQLPLLQSDALCDHLERALRADLVDRLLGDEFTSCNDLSTTSGAPVPMPVYLGPGAISAEANYDHESE